MNSVVLAVLSGIIPALVWLWFWLREDTAKPEPKPLIGEIFLLGAIAVVPAYFFEKELGANQIFQAEKNLLWLLLFWSVIEEGLKYLAVYWGALRTRFYDEPVDAMIYMVTAALGFAAVENTLFILGALSEPATPGLDYLLTGNFRFLGATLVHVVASAVIGGALGITFYSRTTKQVGLFVIGLVGAVALHALFNYFILISDSSRIFLIFGLLWLAGVILILLFERVKGIIIHKQIS